MGKAATCAQCLAKEPTLVGDAVAFDRGVAGGSARREFERRRERRERQLRERHKHLGGLLVALSSDPVTTTAWATGARGEGLVGRSLEALRDEGFAVLHDRRVPASRANIDHVVLSPAGVFVIDAKLYKGRVEQRDVGGWFKRDFRLYVGGRDRSRLVTAMTRQVAAVRGALAPHEAWRAVPVTPVILFVSPDNWPLWALRPIRLGEVYVLWAKKLGELIRRDGPLDAASVPELERALALALPPA